jgi:hypothetical protein
MQDYRICALSPDGATEKTAFIRCQSDEEAVRNVSAQPCGDFTIWRGTELVMLVRLQGRPQVWPIPPAAPATRPRTASASPHRRSFAPSHS